MSKINNINVNGETYGIGNGIYAEVGVTEDRFIELLDRDFYVPTRTEAPTASTLTYVDTDLSVCDFRIGQQCRVVDGESEQGYTFYQLYDITSDGKAVWAEAGSGAKDLTETLLLTLTSNQAADTGLNGAVVHVKYGDVDEELTWQGATLTIPIPLSVTYTVEYPAVEGYATPANGEYLALAGNTRIVTAAYNTEVVTVTVAADDGTSMAGQTVTVGGTEYTYSEPISLKVPYGTEYSVSVDAKSGYNTPASQTFTAGQTARAVTLTYAYIKKSVITIDQTVTDPATMISGDVNGEFIQWIRQNSHRVLAKYTAAGAMTYCRLDDSDSTKYHDGTAAVLTGNEGDVFMKMPTFYYKGTEGDQVSITFAKDKIDDNYVKWDGNTLIGVYEAYNSSGKLYSRSGVASTGSVSQANFKTYARARGTGFSIVTWRQHCVMAFLFYAQYGHMNCQAKIGAGTNSYSKSTGGTNALGMEDTVAGGNGDSGSINFWGLENWWGNKYEWVDNVVVNPTSANGVWRITEADGTVRDVQGVTGSGYVSKMKVGANLDLVPTAYGGTATTGYCDYGYTHTSSAARVVRRSYGSSSADGGVAFAYASSDSSYAYTSYGSRLAFSGSLTEAASVSAYKALTAIG